MKKFNRNSVIVVAVILLVAVGAFIFTGKTEPNARADAQSGEYEEEMAAERDVIAGMVMPAEDGDSVFMENFKTLDLYGREVTDDIFSDYDLTMVYVWGTYCNPCIQSMPVLYQLYNDYADKDVNVIGIVCDVQNSDGSPYGENLILARDIAYFTGAGAGVTAKPRYEADGSGENASFTNILMSENILESVMRDVSATPTIFFVDSEGGNVGNVYTGGRPLKEWSDIIDEML